jgi:2-keto-4-pentenoate hydratase/2-oxohepta-3-ene-1,7-dioic acid hydratase in catechol pathway
MRILRVEYQHRVHYCSVEAHGSAREQNLADEQQLTALDAAPWFGGKPNGLRIPRADARLLAPVAPSKIVCVGRNYAAHAKELGNELPREPLIFLKPPSSLCASGDAIQLPPSSERVEHEAEIGLVIGSRLQRASVAQARDALFGVTCVNDVTARDLQRKDVQFTRAKGFDTFCPVGPWIETEADLRALTVSARVNGAVRQQGHAQQMIFPILELVAFISEVMTLEPGDLISTGTPEGVGPLRPGDTVEVEVGGVGTLVNRVE